MSDIYQFTVSNETSKSQKYSVFIKQPEHVSGTGPPIWPYILDTTQIPEFVPVRFDYTIHFTVIVGTSRGKMEHGVGIDIGASMPIMSGSTVRMIVDEDGRPSLVAESSLALHGCVDIITDEFDKDKAASDNWTLGLGLDSYVVRPAATFSPEPGSKYQIRLPSIWGVVQGDFQRRAVFDSSVAQVCEIDMTQFPKGKVQIIDDETGELKAELYNAASLPY